MAFYTTDELNELGFKALGKNIKISTRAAIYRPEEMEVGDNVRIDDFCIVSGKIKFGRNVHLAQFSNVSGGASGVVFDDFSGLAYGCHVFTGSDDYSGKTLTNATVPFEYKGHSEASIYLGRHVIIGTNSVIFPGVSLAEGTAVGALSMITKNTLPWSIYFGAPAKKIKDRKKDLLTLEQRYLNKFD